MVQNLEGLIIAMFDCATALPNVEGAREDVGASLVAIGTAQPSVFLSAAHAFLMQHNKLSGPNRAFVLLSVNRVLESGLVLDLIDEQQALLIINLATQEMAMSKENEEEWPQAACDLLVTLAKKNRLVGHVMDALLQKFPPALTTPPHRYVVLALASVAEHNAVGFVPFLTDVLSRTIPLLQYVRGDAQRHAWSHALRSFCESVREYTTAASAATNLDEKQSEVDGEISPAQNAASPTAASGFDPQIVQQNYADQMELAYDAVFTWLASKDQKVRAEAANCVGELCLMISAKRVNDDLRKIVPNMLGLYRRATADQHLITQGVCRFLEATCADETSPLEPYLEDILNALFPHVCVLTEPNLSSNVVMRNQSEAFRCFHVAATRFADKIVYYLLHKMQNIQDSCKLGAINVLRHLLNSAGPYIEDKRSLVILGLKPMLQVGNDGALSVRVKKGMCQLCVALADHGYVDADGGEHVIAFLVRNLIAQEDSAVKKTSTYGFDVEGATPAQLRTQCGQALQTIANTCVSAHKLLWPFLFEYVCMESYTPALTDIFKCIRILAERTTDGGGQMDFETGFDNVRVAGSFQVLSRLVTCMSGAPLNAALMRRAREALRLTRALSPWFHHSLEKVVRERYDLVDTIMGELSPPGSFPGSGVMREEHVVLELRSSRVAKWHAHVLDLLDECVRSVNDGEWRCSLAAAMAKQLGLYSSLPDEKAFLMRCLGGVLARITNTSFVVDHLLLMFRGASHAQHAERVGCAQAVGYCGTTHTDLVLTELENVAKWENLKKSAGLFGFIKDAMPYKHYTDIEMVNLRATIMLTYGYVIFYCPTDVVTQRLEQTVLLFLRPYMENPRQETVVREALLETIYLIAVTVHPAHLAAEYRFEARNELLGYVKDYIQSESPEMLSSSIRLLGGKAVATLVKLEPPLSDTDVWEIGQVLTKFTFSLCRERSGLKTEANKNEALHSAALAPFVGVPSATAMGRKPSVGSGYAPQRHASLPPPSSLPVPGSPPLIPPCASLSNAAAIACSSTLIPAPDSVSSLLTARRKGSTAVQIDDDESSTMMEATVHQFHSALEQIVKKNAVVATVTLLLKLFQPFYSSAAGHERARAVDASVLVLHVYFENATDFALGRASDFGPMSSLLARLVPRIADSLCSIRHAALRAVHWTFRLSFAHKGLSRDSSDTSLFDPDAFIRQHLGEEGKLDGQTARKAIKLMAEVIESRLPQSQMQTYLSGLFEMLNDRQSQVSSAAAQLLTNSLTHRGDTLCAEAETLVTTILAKLPDVHACVQTYTDLLAALIAFASHQLYSCIDVLLIQPLPYSVSTTDAWHTLAHEGSLFAQMADHVLELMMNGCGATSDVETPFEVLDTGAGSSVKIVKPEVCTLAAALTELIKAGEPEEELLKRIPQILTALLQFLAAVVDTQYPVLQKENKDGTKAPLIITPELRRLSSTPAALASQALRTLLLRTRDDSIVEEMNAERAWSDCVDTVHFTTAICVLSRSINEHRPAWIAPLVRLLVPRMDSPSDAYRTAAAAVLASLVKRCPNEQSESDSEILDMLVNALTKGLEDKNLRIRKLSVRGLGDIAGCRQADVQKYSSQAIRAAMSGLDDSGDRRDEVAMEAINALNKLSTRVDNDQLNSILSSVLLKLRPCFEKESGALRAVSFSLFGELGSRVGSCDAFREQLLVNIVSILLHLNDEEDQVKQMCARCLTLVGELLNSDAAASLISRELKPDEKCRNYLQFLREFCMILAFSFPDRINYYALNCNNYFKSTSSRIRANAAYMTGFLLGELTAELRSTVSKELIFAGLMLLLKDHDVEVRLSTARAISCLNNYA
ncbi:Maestro heat-like repeat-containing protein family member 1 [Toxocara canis]|uniref:Maestro heat-like repeat-containing protein family member 1 n=1 Tax=Toxocara canis TaxID=6265 RepID=A0A0B2UV86_TOXCA|nr:Maestro heat-like repeat-containing protein family member 1 [Toxocara canis]